MLSTTALAPATPVKCLPIQGHAFVPCPPPALPCPVLSCPVLSCPVLHPALAWPGDPPALRPKRLDFPAGREEQMMSQPAKPIPETMPNCGAGEAYCLTILRSLLDVSV